MGQINSMHLPEPGTRSTATTAPSKSRLWPWILVLAAIVVGGWFYRSSRNASQAADPPAAGAANKSKGGPSAGNFVVPVVVATAQRGDLPVYFNGQVNLERYGLLFKEGVIPKQQLDTQAALVGQVDGAIASDQSQIDNAKLQLTYSRITAPISGRIGLRLVDAGNIVHATDANGLLVITQLQPISVIFSLPQDQLPDVNSKLRSGVQLPVEAYDRDDTAKIATGKLLTIDNQIDLTTGTYKLKSMFANADNSLFPNQFVNVHLLVDTRHNLIIVPTPAIQRGPQGTYVYAVGSDNKVKIRTVAIALTAGNSVGLSTGLNPGDVVVIDGQDKLQDDSKVAPTPAGGNPGSGRAGAAQSSSGQASPQSGTSSGGKRGGSPR